MSYPFSVSAWTSVKTCLAEALRTPCRFWPFPVSTWTRRTCPAAWRSAWNRSSAPAVVRCTSSCRYWTGWSVAASLRCLCRPRWTSPGGTLSDWSSTPRPRSARSCLETLSYPSALDILNKTQICTISQWGEYPLSCKRWLIGGGDGFGNVIRIFWMYRTSQFGTYSLMIWI